jgi:fluoride ion exporter CrcB/FEX
MNTDMNAEGTSAMTTTPASSRYSHHDDELAPELADLHLTDRPDGPGAAMMISAGIGIFVLGLLTVLAEASSDLKTWLQKWEWGVGVGPLAGKTSIASLAYVVSLVVLWLAWRHRNADLRKAFYVGVVLGLLGAIGTFPTFFQAFAP